MRLSYTNALRTRSLVSISLALPTKPINFVPLSDADPESSLSFVMQKLLDSGIDCGISVQQMAHMERLGGRASDLESVSRWIGPFISLF